MGFADENKQIMDEFDAIDVTHAGVVTTAEIGRWVQQRTADALAAFEVEKGELLSKGDAGKRAAVEK